MISKRVIDAALAIKAWDLGNQVLYELCQNYPLHDSPDAVIAKVWLIGRSYSAAIERRRTPSAYGDSFYVDHVAPAIIASDIDQWIDSLQRSISPSEDASRMAVAVHHRLTTLFEEISGQRKRSLASKYLHFHRPKLFFLYDSRAVSAIRSRTPIARRCPGLITNEQDPEYAPFYRRCLWLQDDLQQRYGRSVSPRELDKILLYLADTPQGRRH